MEMFSNNQVAMLAAVILANGQGYQEQATDKVNAKADMFARQLALLDRAHPDGAAEPPLMPAATVSDFLAGKAVPDDQ